MSEQGADESSQKGSQYLLHLYRGSDLLLKEQVAEARQELEEASRIDPDDPKGLSLLGLVYFRLEEYELAQQIYELLVSRYPSEAPLRVNLGLVYMKQGRAGDARDEMLRAVEFDPNHQRAYGYLGLLHSEAGDHERARVAFAKAGQDAMVQRMEELLASHQQPPAVGPDPAVPAAVAKPAPGAPSQAAQAPGQMREAPPALSSMSVVSMEGAPMPSGAMPPMVSDAMTQPVAVPTGNGPDALAEDALGVDPFASWGAELNDQGDATPDAVQEQPSQGLGASDERGFGAAPPPVSVDWGVDSSPGIPMAAPSEPIETGGGGFAAPVDQEQVAPAPTVAGVMDWPGDPTMAAADAGSAQSEEVVGGLGSAAETSQSPEMAAPVEPPGPGGQPEPWVAEGLHRAGESFIAESEVSDALDQAVGPEEPWPTRTGVALPMQAPSDGTPEGSAAGIASSVAQPQAVQAVGARTDGLGPVPIFAFATTELVDLGARHERISCSSDGLLLFAIEEDGFFRADSLVAKVGDLKFEPAFRRAKGANVEEPMEDRRGLFLKAKGEGLLVCSAGTERLVLLDLFDDFIYVRSEHLFAFESTLHWENGKIRGQTGTIPLVHVRGEGRLALACDPGLRKLRLVPDRPALVAEASLVGWVGRVIPQTVARPSSEAPAPQGAPLLRCEGEGIILVLPARIASGSWSERSAGSKE